MRIKEIKKYYDIIIGKCGDWRRKHIIWRLVDELKWRWICANAPKKGKVLDAGGGTGRWAIPLAKRGCEFFLVGISEKALCQARKNIMKEGLENRIYLYKGDIRKLPFPSNFFDFILCEGDIIGITPMPNKALKELSRVLKPNKKILINFNNYYSFLLLTLQMSLKEYFNFKKTRIIKMGGLKIKTLYSYTNYQYAKKSKTQLC